MYPVSEIWTTLAARSDHVFESKVAVNGVDYPGSQIFGMSVDLRMFSENQPSVGGCLAAELTLSMLAPSVTIPRMATVNPFVRVKAGNQTSEWIPQGKFFIDTRETTANGDGLPILTIHAFDAMLKAEADFSAGDYAWPAVDRTVVRRIANILGVSIDTRTIDPNDRSAGSMPYDESFIYGMPVGFSMREILEMIAAARGGNWVMTYDGNLNLIPINGIPAETRYLVTAAGDTITFGGVRILV